LFFFSDHVLLHSLFVFSKTHKRTKKVPDERRKTATNKEPNHRECNLGLKFRLSCSRSLITGVENGVVLHMTCCLCGELHTKRKRQQKETKKEESGKMYIKQRKKGRHPARKTARFCILRLICVLCACARAFVFCVCWCARARAHTRD
jgi:hypothetical protein